jgi:hypothetical protein
MRQISSTFRARLDAGATTLCACWRVVRRDGVVQGFTDHDVDIVFDGVTYSAASGLDGSGFETDLGFAVGGAEAAAEAGRGAGPSRCWPAGQHSFRAWDRPAASLGSMGPRVVPHLQTLYRRSRGRRGPPPAVLG